MTFNCTCTRCGGTGEGVTIQQAKFSCHHKVGCGRKIGILNWDNKPTTEKIAKEILQELEPTAKPKPKKKKSKKKKAEE